MSDSLITPRVVKGFRDYLPGPMMAREHLMETARRVYRSYGFTPIDTPALEYSEILLGKGGEESDKQLFRFMQGDRDVAMRFDLTVPLARYAAQHIAVLGTPFKRYHIAPVWRGENPQAGRFREFIQCDFDTIGTTSNVADIETLLVIFDLLRAIGIERFTIRVNNRLVLNGVLEKLGLLDRSVGVLRAIDKLPKEGAEAVKAELQEKAGLTQEQSQTVLNLLGGGQTLDSLEQAVKGSETAELGIHNLRQLFDAVGQAGLPTGAVELDISIARGLDYYTGTIYETFLTDLPKIGSVCSGGRYDNLAELFTKQKLPGVGASLGLDRLLAAMETLGLGEKASTPAKIFIPLFDENFVGRYQGLARRLRAAGLPCEVYPEAKKLGKQLQYADRKGFRVAVIAGDQEFAQGQWQIKNLIEGGQQTVADDQLEMTVQALLHPSFI